MFKRITYLFFYFSLGLFAFSSFSFANPTLMEQHKVWGAYSYKNNGTTECYVLSVPQVRLPEDLRHGDIFFLIVRKPDGNLEPQLQVGYNLRNESTVTVVVGNEKFEMFENDTAAFLKVTEDEPRLVDAMRRGSRMAVSATSSRGNETSYKFSLSGISAALNNLSTCN